MLIKNLENRQFIRIQMRLLRNSLNVTYRQNQAIKISNIALNCSFIANSKNIALFFPFDGEINTYPLIVKLWLNNKNVFLPVISSFKKKQFFFVPFNNHSTCYLNKYNIFEPFFNIKNIISPECLDLIIVPLVAFDKSGSRLGMGGGFYDIFLENWRKKIFSVGFSYDFQLVNYIPKCSWDVSLPIILTPEKIWYF